MHSKYSLPDLASHEAIPGHVWQGEYANKLPLIRTLLAFNAYSEGWALYAEQLVDELGVYDDFPVGRLGYLQSIAFRACRLVVDSGLHAKRWTRQQAVDFFVERNGSNPLEVAWEVDRYCAWPGQACGYKVGHNEINRLRDKAKARARARNTTCASSTMRWSRAATCRWTCWPRTSTNISRGRRRRQRELAFPLSTHKRHSCRKIGSSSVRVPR